MNEREELKEARARKGWTVATAAKKLGFDDKRLRGYEKGRVSPNYESARRIAIIYGDLKQSGEDDEIFYLIRKLLPDEHYSEVDTALRKQDSLQGAEEQNITDLIKDKIHDFPSESPTFTGRKTVLQILSKKLGVNSDFSNKRNCFILTGIGGIGKSQLARAFVNQNSNNYTHIVWMRAETEIELSNSFRNLAEQVGLPIKNENDDSIRQIVITWLEKTENQGWLLIFDDIEDPNYFDKIAPVKGGSVLGTSRKSDWGSIETIKIGVFERIESVELLSLVSNEPKSEFVHELAEILGDFPLALAQAGSFIKLRKESGIDAKTYIDIYRKSHEQLWQRESSPIDYQHTIATTWQITIEQIRKNDPEAEIALQLFSFLQNNNIPAYLLETWGIKVLNRTKENSLLGQSDTLNKLSEYSMIEVDKQMVTIHKIVQTVVRDSMSQLAIKKCLETLRIILTADFNFNYQNIDTWKKSKEVAAHVDSFFGFMQEIKTEKQENLWKLYDRLSSYYLKILSKMDKAIQYGKESLFLCIKLNGDDHLETANIFRNLGSAYDDKGEYDKAIEFCSLSLDITKNKLGESHSKTATIFNELGIIYKNKGAFDKAVDLCSTSLKIRKNVLEKTHPDIASSYNNLGVIYKNKGEYQKSIDCHLSALEIQKENTDGAHPDIAVSYLNLASSYFHQDQYDESIKYYSKALKIREQLLGKNHFGTSSCYEGLAIAYRRQGKLKEALECNLHAMDIAKSTLGFSHPKVALCYNNTGLAYSDLKEHDSAIACFLKCLGIREEKLGEDHLITATTYCNLSGTYLDIGNYDDALVYVNKALKIFQENLPSDHSYIKAAKYILGQVNENLLKISEN